VPSIKLLTAATATNSAPSGAAAGVSRKGAPGATTNSPNGLGECDEAVILIASTAGSGVMTGTFKLWGYSPLSAAWHPIGTHATAATKGVLNQGNAIGETGTDVVTHAELVQGLGVFTRLYLEITAIGGTNTAFSAWLANGGVRA
jgi:hypothetical protein